MGLDNLEGELAGFDALGLAGGRPAWASHGAMGGQGAGGGMTEDEMIAAAIAASLEDAKAS